MQVTFNPAPTYEMWVRFQVEINGQPIDVTWSTADGYGYDIELLMANLSESEKVNFAQEFESLLPAARAVVE